MEISNKSTLAKLLATENISLEHQKVETAYFDLKERKIVLPMWKEMDSDVYDMLIGHEVSHALNTPLEGWHDNVMEYGPAFKSFLNVVEDARIERLIKKKFPGIVKNFYAGYRKLFDTDFFGTADRDVSTYGLIDRINLHFKVGSMLGISFTDEEQVLVNRVAECETWDDVVAVASDLFAHAKENEEQQEKAPTDSDFDDLEDEEEEMEAGSGPAEESEEQDEEEQDQQPGSEGETSEDAEETEDEPEQSNDPSTFTPPSQEPMSETDQAFRENEGSLLNNNAREILYGKWTDFDPKHWVVPASKTWDTDWKDVFYDYSWKNGPSEVTNVEPIAERLAASFKKKNTAYINMLVQQFEMKRKAKTLARARQNRTGELNMKKLWATQLTEDVFLSNTVLPEGKNHGMMMLVDFSGSMHNDLPATIEQTLVMIAFCKKVNIPFDVYLFTTNGDGYSDEVRSKIKNQGMKPGHIFIERDGFQMIQMVNSSMSAPNYKKAFRGMLLLAEVYNRSRHRRGLCGNPYNLPNHLQTGGTPLVETVFLARNLVNKFKRDNHIEVMNTIILTDGDPTGTPGVVDSKVSGYHADKIAITENGVTTVETKLWDDRWLQMIWYRAALKHFKKTTDSRLINFHIGKFRKSDIRHAVRNSGNSDKSNFEDKWKTEMSNGFFEQENHIGFDVAYFIKNGDSLAIDEDQSLEVKSDSKGDLLRGFKKFQKNKASNRVFLNKFMDKVA